MPTVDSQIAALIKGCPNSVRGHTGDLTLAERESFGRLQYHQLSNRLSTAVPDIASQLKWINPKDGTVMYEDDHLRTIGLQGLGFTLADLGGEQAWLPNDPRVINAFKQAKHYE